MRLEQTFRAKFSVLLFSAMFLLTLSMVSVAQEKIAFVSIRDNLYGEIYIMNADGTNQMRLTDDTFGSTNPSLSSDGSKIVFESQREGGSPQIYVMNADGSNETRLTSPPFNSYQPSFSGDGSKIAFASDRSGVSEIYVMNADGSNQTRLTNTPLFSYYPSFSPDGSKIAFTSLRDGTIQIYIMNADGTNQTRLTNIPAFASNPSFSSDGSKIAFISDTEIYVMNIDGSNQTRLTFSPGNDEHPSYSPDGSRIAFTSFRDGTPRIYVMNPDGSNPAALTNPPFGRGDGGPSWGGRANAAPTITAASGVTRARDAGASNSPIASVNDAEDAENALSVTVNGSSSASSNGVTVSGITVDSSGSVTANIAAGCGASAASFTLRVTDSGGLFSEATLDVAVTAETVLPVISLPSDIVTTLPLNSNDTGKVVDFTVSATDNCDADPSVSAVPASGSAFAVGTTTVNVTATDESGNTATGSFTVSVLYNFAGFFQPVDNLPMVNLVSAGQAIPVKFSLSGDKGLNIFAAGYPVSQQIACVGGSTVSAVEETVTAGSSSLGYDPGTDRYIYVWKTERAWRGTCRQLLVKLNDGSVNIANFQFK